MKSAIFQLVGGGVEMNGKVLNMVICANLRLTELSFQIIAHLTIDLFLS